MILFALHFLKQHLFSFKFESRGKCISIYCQQNINPDFYGMTRHIDRVIKNLYTQKHRYNGCKNKHIGLLKIARLLQTVLLNILTGTTTISENVPI